MERQFFINWQAFIEEAKQRRKSERLTQAKLAKMVGVSTPTISRFENGEKDIQLSTALNILSILGMIDQRNLIFPDSKPHYDAKKEIIIFTGIDRGKTVSCAITRETLEDYFESQGKDPLTAFQKQHERIEHEARRKYLRERFEPDGFIVIKSEDIF